MNWPTSDTTESHLNLPERIHTQWSDGILGRMENPFYNMEINIKRVPLPEGFIYRGSHGELFPSYKKHEFKQEFYENNQMKEVTPLEVLNFYAKHGRLPKKEDFATLHVRAESVERNPEYGC